MSHPDNHNVFNSILASSIHDMKNSLAVLLNDLETLEQQLPKDDSTLKQMRHQGQRLNNNFMQLLSLYRIDNKQYTINITENCIYDTLEEAYLENEILLNSKSIALTIDCDESLLWYYDKAMLQGSINTLINNAYRYANSNITLKAEINNKMLHIQIMDDGPGYPTHMLKNMQNINTDIDFQNGNTGLGIYFARTIAEAHINKNQHGYIQLSNNGINKGACFAIVLP